MIWQTLIFQPDSTILLLHVGIDDKSSGGKIALLIIILALILLSVAQVFPLLNELLILEDQ